MRLDNFRRFAKRWRRRLFGLYYRLRYWRRYYPADLTSGGQVMVDMWNRNWRLMRHNRVWEQDVEEVVQAYLRPDDVLLDIGAQVGLLTSQASQRVGPLGSILSFEPDPENYVVLAGLVARNRLDNVRLCHFGLSDSEGEITFRRPVGSWGSFMKGQSREALDSGFRAMDFNDFTVCCLRLDDVMDRLAIGRVDLIKIDVDGPEVSVLNGATNTLKRFQPLVIVEASRHYADHGFTVGDLFDLMLGLGYELYYAQRNSKLYTKCSSPEELTIDISVRGNAVDFFAVP
ncbi:FkbM family methyltransferase, partial [Akkermansiaceae bacterium]|nr:FkbM family methyltransferase [Akkermansiaceae bacterium]